MKLRSLYAAFAVAGVTCIAIIFGAPRSANAATFAIIPDTQTFAVNEQFTASVTMDTEGIGVNAAQGTISFSPEVLSVVSVDKSGSALDLFVQEPSFSNQNGTITFIGASTKGVVSASANVLKIKFSVKGSGKSDIVFTEGSIRASDGSATNVLKARQGISITATGATNVSVIPPSQITRKAEAAQKTPAAPVVSVPLYPDPEGWSNLSQPFSASWTPANDVSGVAAVVDKSPKTNPTKSEGLFDNKSFSALESGAWYLHVRFKNNVGWGETTHYRIGIDPSFPTPFTIDLTYGESTTNPSPTLSYVSNAKLSGVSYRISIDRKDPEVTTSTTFALPALAPGSHTVTVEAVSGGGNSTKNTLDVVIAPIAQPTMALTNPHTYQNEGGLAVSGTTEPGDSIRIILKNESKAVVATETATANDAGKWSIVLGNALPGGTYSLQATHIDVRGAQSIPLLMENIPVTERPAITIFGLSITRTGIIWTLIGILIASFGIGYFISYSVRKQRENRILIAERDVANTLKNTRKEIMKALMSFDDKKLTNEEIANIEYTLRHTAESLEKTEPYITDNIGEIDK